MAKPDLNPESRPITRQTHVEWECPFCQRANGIPEISVCACGATRAPDGGTATVGITSIPAAPAPAVEPAPADVPADHDN